MNHPLWAYLFGVFLILHGLGHAAGLYVGNRTFGALWLLGLIGFVPAGLAFLGVGVPRDWWRPLAVAAALASITTILLFWPPSPGPKLNALIANMGILAVVWWHWPLEPA